MGKHSNNQRNIFDKIRRKLVNLFNGKNSYKTFIKQYEIDRIGNIKKANKAKIFCVASTLGGVMKQMEMANAQIAQKFAERQGASI